MTTAGDAGLVRRRWDRLARAVAWTPPTSTEIGTVAKSALAAGLAWWFARTASSEPSPVLASLTAVVVVEVSVRASVVAALQRSAGVVLGVFLALAVGDTLPLNGLTVALLVGLGLAVAQLVLRLPRAAARQVPISGLVVLSALAANQDASAWHRALDTLIGAAVGVAVSLLLPASRLVDARQTLERLGDGLDGELATMGTAIAEPWTAEQSREWRRTSHIVRDRLVEQAAEAVGHGRESARWNMRDRRHQQVLARYEDALPPLQRTAIGVWTIARSLDDQARAAGGEHEPVPVLGGLLVSMGTAVKAAVRGVLDEADDDLAKALTDVRRQRERAVRGATRRATAALEQGVRYGDPLEGEWLGYATVLVQVDRMVTDLQSLSR